MDPPANAPIRFSNSSLSPDTEIIISDIYNFDSTTLRHVSQFFDRSLSSRWWKPENTHNGEDGIKYKYQLEIDEKEIMSSMLEPVPPEVTNSSRKG